MPNRAKIASKMTVMWSAVAENTTHIILFMFEASIILIPYTNPGNVLLNNNATQT